jgi:hypothetical protein
MNGAVKAEESLAGPSGRLLIPLIGTVEVMTTSPPAVTLPAESRATILGAIDAVLANARTGYTPTPGNHSTGAVDFHVHAAVSARAAIAAMTAENDVLFARFSSQETEALSKILARSRYINSPERRKTALAVRRILTTAEVK